MKVSSSVYNHPKLVSNRDITAILPLIPIEDGIQRSDQMITHTLRSTPAVDTSPKYKINVHIIQGDEDCRSIIKWSGNVVRVIEGLNIQEHNAAKAVAQTLVIGTPLTLFNQGVENAKDATYAARVAAAVGADQAATAALRLVITREGKNHANNLTMLQIVTGLGHVVTHLLPRRVLARVKRYLRRDCRKPRDM